MDQATFFARDRPKPVPGRVFWLAVVVVLAGCLSSPADHDPLPASVVQIEKIDPAVKQCDDTRSRVVAGAAGKTFVAGAQYCKAFELRHPTGALFNAGLAEMRWTSTAPDGSRVELAILDEEGREIASTWSTENVVRLALPEGSFEPASSIVWQAGFDVDGAVLEFQAEIALSLFDRPVPPEYSAFD
jgi:hypothetical protein